MEKVGSRTPRECVDWNLLSIASNALIDNVALPVSAWIEMLQDELELLNNWVALPVSAWIEIDIKMTYNIM